ncbi:phosphorylase [Aphanizomenon flos-aquae NRERC-008]|jgi:ATP adenylyltransferase|uniref:Phosphorylase n=1 Tax=Aphanizomenon flos-aquae FACHB-1249 TaxID=2692889 RepID=A0ABR8IS53_APHFL|nr:MULTISPECIES: phosphorylase [Aphanizomenon]MBD2390207.1 phosphorylase [Aphanizomenon flos-aquae FACHB-1171]MBD2555792.1 phosphorylase [Aphanizomenon flos-aquae FACHB-1290]MBD2631853.1 phosphorylase [Aphanizomenon sp. FACHB-1399]MBD2642719.1 phosphorylase [Aphanizomenon sp. FACHB-1401]MBD2657075.1 phosphorylase [Aphanizomenon flos-aquae FACHB-1265]
MNQLKILLEPGTLWTSIKTTTEQALKSGALKSIPTELEIIEQNGVQFIVRILANLNRKEADKEKQNQQITKTRKEFNPFLPYEKDLFVADISDTHVCILNKFNVVDFHLLIITRIFEEQESLLTLQDFTAMWTCLGEFEGLVFYNGGKLAGASQRHKHLQIVPFSETDIPISPLLKTAKLENDMGTIREFPFLHAFTNLNRGESPKITLEKYHTLLQKMGIKPLENNLQSGAYNLLITQKWMLIVPRKQEEIEGISINSLGFAGALLVKNQQQMELVKNIKPMEILSKVAFPVQQN